MYILPDFLIILHTKGNMTTVNCKLTLLSKRKLLQFIVLKISK